MKKRVLFVLSVWLSINLMASEKSVTGSSFRKHGRVYEKNNVLWTGFSASGVSFYTDTANLEVTFKGDNGTPSYNPDGNTNLARMGVFVDGVKEGDFIISSPEQKEIVFSHRQKAMREIKILKLSESSNSLCGIKSVSVDDESIVQLTEEKKLKIEFIGDSITCGYGVDDLNLNHHFSTRTEDATKSYAFKTAVKMNADWSFVSCSGWGIVSGYSGNDIRNEKQLIPAIYEKTAFSYNTAENVYLQSVSWDFNKFNADIVVLNLGTNDFSWVKNRPERKSLFEKEYVDFLKVIRKNNPEAHIVCCLGIMGSDLFRSIETSVKQFSEETGDKRVTVLQFAGQIMSDGIGADWHPSEITHEKASNVLVKKLSNL